MITPDVIINFFDRAIPALDSYSGFTDSQYVELHKMILQNFARHLYRDAEYLESLSHHGEPNLRHRREKRANELKQYASIVNGMADSLRYPIAAPTKNEQVKS